MRQSLLLNGLRRVGRICLLILQVEGFPLLLRRVEEVRDLEEEEEVVVVLLLLVVEGAAQEEVEAAAMAGGRRLVLCV